MLIPTGSAPDAGAEVARRAAADPQQRLDPAAISISSIDCAAALEQSSSLVSSLPRTAVLNRSYLQVHLDDPRITGKGEHAVVLREENSPIVVKLVGVRDDATFILAEGKQVLSSNLPLELMVDSLRELLSSHPIAVADHYEGSFTAAGQFQSDSVAPEIFYFHASPDLTANGRYIVTDAIAFDFDSLSNGSELQRSYDDAVAAIVLAPRSDYILGYAAHRLTCACGAALTADPATELPHAIKKMFFVVHDPLSNIGRIVIGDIDHVTIVAKDRALAHLSANR